MNFVSKIPVLRSFARAYALTKFKKEWCKRNKQNQTVPMNTFPMECVEIGNGTYGELHILSYFPPIEKLTIGNYVSLASNVHFILSGNHQTETLFTYPIRSTLEGKHCQTDSRSKGPIIVEDEVWIGYGATILSGVTIGSRSHCDIRHSSLCNCWRQPSPNHPLPSARRNNSNYQGCLFK